MSNNNKADRVSGSEFVNPVFCENGKWFFWDECWADCHGPYADEETAEQELKRYVEEYL